MNNDLFFDGIKNELKRLSLGNVKPKLSQGQVDGINGIIAATAKDAWPIAWVAYALATVWHETQQTMQPVREAFNLSENWRKKNLRYYPHYGRGLVQITWPDNYAKADKELDLGGKLIANLDLALDPVIATRIMVWGMSRGRFTGIALKDTLPPKGPADLKAFTKSRPIINKMDDAGLIAGYAMAFQRALIAGGY